MKSNILIKGLAAFIVVILVVVVLKAKKGSQDTVDIQPNGDISHDLTAIESGPAQPDNGLGSGLLDNEFLEDEFGVDTDSPVETMRTLTRETRAVREDSLLLQEENKRLKQEVNRLLGMKDSIGNSVRSELDQVKNEAEVKQREVTQTQSKIQQLISQLDQKVKDISASGKNRKTSPYTSANGYEIGDSGIPDGLGYEDSGQYSSYDDVVWHNPIDAKTDDNDPSKISLPDFTGAKETIKDLAKTAGNSDPLKESRLIRAYTIPENATLLGSISMTAMLGRIPSNGQVVDPYPFKIMIGEENLSSNGIHIPGVVGIKMSGVAKGDWTLSCVSGDIRSMTFTFRDGTIRTIPEPGEKSEEPIAWFSDTYGIPCVTGTRITNAATYLSSRVALTTAASYANAEAATQFTTQSDASSTSSSLTGDSKTVAKNVAISEGIGEVTDWLDERQENSFDAIYVPPGTEIAVHINHELKIDYDPEGRKVNHYADLEPRSKRYLD